MAMKTPNPIATGMSTADLLSTNSSGNFAFQGGQPDYSNALAGLFQSGMGQASKALQPQMISTPMKREYQPFQQQPGEFQMQEPKPALPPDIQALVQALRGAING